jgi:biopolymer transport protein ExbD
MKISSPIPKRRSRIVIIPLIDIMFFLLASFMMISLQMSRTANIKVNLPSATQSGRITSRTWSTSPWTNRARSGWKRNRFRCRT